MKPQPPNFNPCLLLGVLIVSGCIRNELPVLPHESGNVTVASVDMDPLYKYQVYYNLKANAVVGRNEKTIWDLGFETTADGFHVVLNSAKTMFALATAKSDFLSVTAADSMGFAKTKKWDANNGSMDSTAIADWRGAKPVYIIDRGFSETGAHQGWAKIQFESVTSSGYKVRFSRLDGTDEHTLSIAKDSTYNLSFLSFTSNAQVAVEPPKSAWDIVFSQYAFIFYDMDPPVPYLVAGCLLNRYNTHAYHDTVVSFEQTTFGTIAKEKLVNDISIIGYDWKVFNGTTYTVNTKNNYIVEDANGLFYKLHFTGFYSATGVKGNPHWEYQRL